MLAASEAWKTAQEGFIAPEGFVEIAYQLTLDGVQEIASVESDDQAVISSVYTLLSPAEFDSGVTPSRVATNELNLWALDGTMDTFYRVGQSDAYVSESLGTGSVRATLSEVKTESAPGVTIFFSEEYGEYAEEFTVTAYNGSTAIATKTVTGNTSVRCVVEMSFSGFDAIEVVVHKWCLPQRRVRIENITLGIVAVFKKGDILSFNHEQVGCLNSGELPRNTITFSLDNTSGFWNPTNPSGYGKYLSERQRLVLRYGFDLDGTKEWVYPGVFYLTEWHTPSNGLEAHFVAGSWLEFLLDFPYRGPKSGTLYEIAEAAAHRSSGEVPEPGEETAGDTTVDDSSDELSYPVFIHESLNDYTASFEEEYTCAEVLQMCANAASCTMVINNVGEVRLDRVSFGQTDYVIPKNLSYTYPEYELTKPLKSIKVILGESEYSVPASSSSGHISTENQSGEVQTVENPFITTEAQAAEVASWVMGNLINRKHISGEFRADPRAAVYDKVSVETKYATETIILTSVNYAFTGAFRATYSGYVPEAII